jgi:mannitol/fructose-specific phosphotransferase system IIA component (Ntr-type)
MVLLGARAADRADAIKQTGEALIKAGCVAPSYVDGMLARERAMSTYLAPETITQLVHANNPMVIVERLTRGRSETKWN